MYIGNGAVAQNGRSRHMAHEAPLNRRHFLSGIGLASATLATTSLITGCGDSDVLAATTPETDVLNFALNLEYLEATLYSYLVNGTDIPASSTGSSNSTPTGAVTGAPAKLAGLPTQISDLLAEIYFDEISHLNTLRIVLGSLAVLALRSSSTLSALSTTATTSLTFALRRYRRHRIAGVVQSLTQANLQASAQILATEAFHSGALRLLAIQNGAAYPTSSAPADGFDIIPLDPAHQPINGPTTAGAFFATAVLLVTATTPAQTNTYPGFAYTRSTSQVLAISTATRQPAPHSGGFFPSGSMAISNPFSQSVSSS